MVIIHLGFSNKHKWILINVALPLTPFFIGGILRLLFSSQLSWDTFEGSEISICLALSSFFIAQSLLSSKPLLDNDDKKYDLKCKIRNYFLLGAFFLLVFSVNVILACLTINMNLVRFETSLEATQIFSFVTSPFMVIFSINTQETYRLTVASI